MSKCSALSAIEPSTTLGELFEVMEESHVSRIALTVETDWGASMGAVVILRGDGLRDCLDALDDALDDSLDDEWEALA